MLKLKSKTETLITVDCNDLDNFIREVTGQNNWDSVSDQEWGNDSQHRFTISGKLSGYDRNQWEVFKSTGHNSGCLLRTILDGLCADKLIPPGTYLIDVCW